MCVYVCVCVCVCVCNDLQNHILIEEDVNLKCKLSSLNGRPTLHQQDQMFTYKLQDTNHLSVSTCNA